MRIEEIQLELEQLKKIELENQTRIEQLQQELHRMTQTSTMPQTPSMLQTPPMPPLPPRNQPQVSSMPQTPPMPQVTPLFAYEKKKGAADVEKIIGKAWMGILASFLIFASLIFFAAVLIPLLTDTVKMIIMYVFSIAFLSLGLVLLNKKNNAVNVAVSSCGLGALYISMLLSNVYFHVLNDIVLYLFILIWAVGVAYLSKTKSSVFLIIGQIGIIMSVFLGVMSCADARDNTKLFILTLFFMISAIVYELFNKEKKLLNLSFNTVSFAIIAIYSMSAYDFPYLTAVVLWLVIILQIANCGLSKIKIFAVFDIIYVLLGICLMLTCLDTLSSGEYTATCLLYGIAAANIAVAHLLFKEKMSNPNMIAISIFNTFFMMISLIDRAPVAYILLVPLVLMAIGFSLGDDVYKIESYVTLALVCLVGFRELSVSASLLEIIFLIAVLVVAELIPYVKQDKKEWMQLVTFVFLHISLFKGIFTFGEALRENFEIQVADDILVAILLVLLLVLNLIFKFVLNRKEENKPLLYCTYASSAILMFVATIQLYSISISSVNYYITLLIAAAVFANNTYRFIRSKDSAYQLYGVIKVTAFLIVVLTTLQRATILLSIALLVLSIIWILVGFALSAKVIRLYGLVITNISIIKLILVDIPYNSALAKAFGFFICGILCFAISFIYSMIDKNMDKNSKE